MKRKFLDFSKMHYYQKRSAPKVGHKWAAPFRLAAYKTDGEKGEGESEGEDKELSEAEAIKKIGEQVLSFKKMLGEKADANQFTALETKINDLATSIETMKADDISKTIKEINEANEKIHKQLVELQEEAAKAKEEGEKGAPGKVKPMISTKEVQDFVKDTFGDTEGKGKKTNNPAKITIGKAAETFGYATFFEGGDSTEISAFTGRLVDPTLYQRKRKRNLILDNFTIRTINVPKLIYLIKVEDGDDEGDSEGDSGGADWITSGEIKPMRSFRVTTGEAEAKKVAIFGTVEDKLLRDVSSLERWIREDFMDEMREEINDGLLNNDPDTNPDAPLGLKTNAIQYTATPAYANAFAASSTNYIDQIFAILARMAYNKEEAGIVFVASDVYYRIMHLKDSEARYQNNNLVYTDALGRLFIGGTEVVMADEEDIPATAVLAVARDLGFKIYAYGPMVFERGLNGDDFRYDRTSFRGYQEFLSFIPENRENSVLYDTWANIQAAIEA